MVTKEGAASARQQQRGMDIPQLTSHSNLNDSSTLQGARGNSQQNIDTQEPFQTGGHTDGQQGAPDQESTGGSGALDHHLHPTISAVC